MVSTGKECPLGECHLHGGTQQRAGSLCSAFAVKKGLQPKEEREIHRERRRRRRSGRGCNGART